jgi:putative salt-induced outer membrane protein YdiY
MRLFHTAAILVALTTSVFAQDRITLANGDVLTGTIKTMADGKVTITSPLLGDVTVPMANISDMATQAQVELQTVNGETFKRRIAGMESGRLRLDGDVPALALDNLGKINPPQAQPPHWTGTMQIGGSITDGNTQRRSVGAAVDASRRTEVDRISFDASWDYSQDKDLDTGSATYGSWKLNQRRAGGGLKYDYFLDKRWYLLGTGRVLGDTLADINLRFTGGVGVGYTVIENDSTTLLTEVGISYFNENYISNTPSQDYVAGRVAYKLTHAFTDQTKIVHGVEAFPSLERAQDIYLQMKTELVTNLAGNMIASLGWIMDYDNTPAPGRERADHRVLLSIGWSF